MDVTGLPGTATGLLQRQKLDEQVRSLRSRVEKLRAENDDLKAKRDKNEKDTHEFVAYFQQEMEKKDTVIADLSNELTKKEIKFEREVEDLTKNQQITTQDLACALLSERDLGKVFTPTKRITDVQDTRTPLKSRNQIKREKDTRRVGKAKAKGKAKYKAAKTAVHPLVCE